MKIKKISTIRFSKDLNNLSIKAVGIILICTVIIFSCKKENISSPEISDLILCNYTNMQVKQYDTIIATMNNDLLSFDIDIDNDKSSDIRVISDFWGSLAVGEHPRSIIECLTSNVQILGYYANDTSFLQRISVVSIGPGNIVQKDIYHNYTCHRLSAMDTIIYVQNNFKVIPFSKPNIIKNENVFKSDTIILIDDTYSLPYNYAVIDDTMTYQHYTYYNDCSSFPGDATKYIVFKITKGNVVKKGWIKLSISDKNKITIFETAIQR